MRRVAYLLLALIVLASVALGAAYYFAGRAAPPQIAIQQPARVIGRSAQLELTVDVPRDQLETLAVGVEQNGRSLPVFALTTESADALQSDDAGGTRLTQAIGRDVLPELRQGQATIVATASRRVFYGLRTVSSRTEQPVQVRLDPPRISVQSTHHYINQGGVEMIVYRVSPSDVDSGVRVGDVTYPGFALPGGEPGLRGAFFALLHNQDPNVPMELFAQDEAGNEARVPFEHRVFRKVFRRSRIEITDALLSRVVPAILAGSPNLRVPQPAADNLVAAFVAINGELRQINAETIAGKALETSPTPLWKGAFRQLGNSKVEASFADYRTYVYAGKEIDQQVHLGYDLAVTANVPVLAANAGTVLYAADLGIYGNCVILDHGMGVQSLYGHLSSIDVAAGQSVSQGQGLGRSGQTGLAGGDHLHFTMLVNGRAVNPAEWWDPHWMEDRVARKLRDAGAAF